MEVLSKKHRMGIAALVKGCVHYDGCGACTLIQATVHWLRLLSSEVQTPQRELVSREVRLCMLQGHP